MESLALEEKSQFKGYKLEASEGVVAIKFSVVWCDIYLCYQLTVMLQFITECGVTYLFERKRSKHAAIAS